MTDKAAGVYGICLRGKAGWGENMAFLTATANSFGARWFDEKWNAAVQYAGMEERRSTSMLPLMKADGPPGASSNGFNENLALFNDGKCGMWIDATVAASFVTDPRIEGRGQGRLRARARQRSRQARQLAVGLVAGGSCRHEEGRRRGEVHLLGDQQAIYRARRFEGGLGQRSSGHAQVALREPRISESCAFAKMTLDSINSADPTHPTVKPVPYTGVQFVAIPEFQGIATDVGQDFSAALAGTMTVDAALAKAQATTEAAMKKAGYIK